MKLVYNLIAIVGLLLIVAAVLSFPFLLLILAMIYEGKGQMPWNREKEAAISGDI